MTDDAEHQSTDKLKEVFLAYCNLTHHNADKASSATVKKMCTDSGINKSKMKQNDVDLEYSRCFGNSKERFDYKTFVKFIDGFLGPAYGRFNGLEQDEAILEVREKLSNAKPQLTNVTGTSKADVTQRLIDPNRYPKSFQSQKETPGGKSPRRGLPAPAKPKPGRPAKE